MFIATCKLKPYVACINSPSLFIFLPILVLILAIIIKKAIKTSSTCPKDLRSPPGSSGWPVIGEAIELTTAIKNGTGSRFLKDRKEKYASDIFKTNILGMNVVILSGQAGNKFLFTNENKLVKVWWIPSAKLLLGTSLLTLDGEQLTTMRNMMTAFVSRSALSSLYVTTMDSLSQREIDMHWQGKQVVEVFPTIKLHWFKLTCRLFLGVDDEDEIEEHADLFCVFLKGLFSIPIDFPGTRFRGSKKAGIAIKNWLLKIVKKRRDTLQSTATSTPSRDLLSHMLLFRDNNGIFMSESEITNNLHMLIMAGHDPSVAAMTMLMKQLAEHPDIYEKVLKEQQEIASSKAREGREFLQWEDIQKMKYSWNTLLESMRISPPIGGNLREALVDITYQGYHIPKGWKLLWSADLTHSDPKIYPNPEKFDPSRFERDRNCLYSYTTFGGGPRMCLGQEFARVQMLVFLHNIVTRFTWKLVDPDEKVVCDPIGMPVKGLPVILNTHST